MNQRSGIRDQGSENNNGGDQEAERMRMLLQSALPRIDDAADLPPDLWPAMLRRMDEPDAHAATSIPWFDWALAGGLVAFAAIAPRTIPVILYYL
jgi:hypothetical protein